MGEKNDLLSAVASDDVEHLVEYLSCRVFGQAMYRHVTNINYPAKFSPLDTITSSSASQKPRIPSSVTLGIIIHLAHSTN